MGVIAVPQRPRRRDASSKFRPSRLYSRLNNSDRVVLSPRHRKPVISSSESQLLMRRKYSASKAPVMGRLKSVDGLKIFKSGSISIRSKRTPKGALSHRNTVRLRSLGSRLFAAPLQPLPTPNRTPHAAIRYLKANLKGNTYSRKDLESGTGTACFCPAGTGEELEAVQADVKVLRDVRHWLNQVLPSEQYRQTAEPGKKPSVQGT